MADEPFITFTSDYEYTKLDSTGNGAWNEITSRALTFQMDLSNMRISTLHSRIDEMAYLLKDTARSFVSSFIKSGNLWANIDVVYGRDYKGGVRLELGSFAVNQRGQFYGGHIEYGYHPYGGPTFVPARPYMRPAMEIVANSSSVDLAAAIGEAFNEYITGNTLTNTIAQGGRWGSAMTAKDRKAWQGLGKNLGGSNFRQRAYNNYMREKYSIRRGYDNKTNPSNWNSRGRATSKTYRLREDTVRGVSSEPKDHPLSK